MMNTVKFSLKETTSFHKKQHVFFSYNRPFYRVKYLRKEMNRCEECTANRRCGYGQILHLFVEVFMSLHCSTSVGGEDVEYFGSPDDFWQL